MKVFVTGGTGVIGKRAVPALVSEGHEISVVSRDDVKDDLVRQLGGSPVRVDLFDEAAVKAAVEGHEAVINLATNIPPMSKMSKPSNWATNDRLRSEASGYLVDAALAAGATRFVQESIAFPYVDSGEAWVDETFDRQTTEVTASADVAEANVRRFSDLGGMGVVLRFAQFYSVDSEHVIGFNRMARFRINPFLGSSEAYTSFIHADDAGVAVADALRARAGVYNIADNVPMTRGEAGEVVAAALGIKRLWEVPGFVLRAMPGDGASALTPSLRVSNRKFRQATGWAPKYPSIGEGWPTVVR